MTSRQSSTYQLCACVVTVQRATEVAAHRRSWPGPSYYLLIEAVLLPRHIDAYRSPDGRQVRAQAVKHCRHLSPIKLLVPCIARLPPQLAIRTRGSHWRRPKLRERLHSPPAPAWGFRDSDATAYPRRLFVIIVIIHHAVRPQMTVHTSLIYHINHSRGFATCAVARNLRSKQYPP